MAPRDPSRFKHCVHKTSKGVDIIIYRTIDLYQP